MGVEGEKPKKPIPQEAPEGFQEVYRRRHGDRLYQIFEPIKKQEKQEDRREAK
jgi:hypothetical protein